MVHDVKSMLIMIEKLKTIYTRTIQLQSVVTDRVKIQDVVYVTELKTKYYTQIVEALYLFLIV